MARKSPPVLVKSALRKLPLMVPDPVVPLVPVRTASNRPAALFWSRPVNVKLPTPATVIVPVMPPLAFWLVTTKFVFRVTFVPGFTPAGGVPVPVTLPVNVPLYVPTEFVGPPARGTGADGVGVVPWLIRTPLDWSPTSGRLFALAGSTAY